MATLKELWDAGGGKPINVVRGDGVRFTMLGITATGLAVGYNPITTESIRDDWSLYEEPRPKKKLYAYLIDDSGWGKIAFHESRDRKHTRVPQFDVEIEE